jgi:cytochrome c-type biogenesis protein CcmE
MIYLATLATALLCGHSIYQRRYILAAICALQVVALVYLKQYNVEKQIDYIIFEKQIDMM